jgi:hypothetical protein
LRLNWKEGCCCCCPRYVYWHFSKLLAFYHWFLLQHFLSSSFGALCVLLQSSNTF